MQDVTTIINICCTKTNQVLNPHSFLQIVCPSNYISNLNKKKLVLVLPPLQRQGLLKEQGKHRWLQKPTQVVPNHSKSRLYGKYLEPQIPRATISKWCSGILGMLMPMYFYSRTINYYPEEKHLSREGDSHYLKQTKMSNSCNLLQFSIKTVWIYITTFWY